MPSSLPHQRSSAIQPDVNPSGRTPLAVDSLRLENPLQIWLSDCLKDAFTLMEQRAHSFHEGVRGVANFQDEADRAKRYLLIDTLLQSPCSLSGNPGRKILQDIIAGFLHEFSRQTVLGVPPLNIANPNKPQPVAKAFWESRPVELFERQRFPGVLHTARSYHQLLQEHLYMHNDRGSTTGRKAAWDATAELLRASIDTFRARGAEIFPDKQLRASVYNDHLHVIAFTRRTFCLHTEKLRRAA